MDTAENRLKTLQSRGQIKQVSNGNKERMTLSGVKLRFMLALLFFLLFFVMEQKGLTIMGITGEKIYESVCENAKGFDFIIDFPYTLDD